MAQQIDYNSWGPKQGASYHGRCHATNSINAHDDAPPTSTTTKSKQNDDDDDDTKKRDENIKIHKKKLSRNKRI